MSKLGLLYEPPLIDRIVFERADEDDEDELEYADDSRLRFWSGAGPAQAAVHRTAATGPHRRRRWLQCRRRTGHRGGPAVRRGDVDGEEAHPGHPVWRRARARAREEGHQEEAPPRRR